MRIAIVSPYSWTYPGGVTRHIASLTEQLLAAGHEVRVFAPHDPDDRRASLMHRGARPQALELPDYVVPLGRTIGVPANGAVSNLAVGPATIVALRRGLRSGGFDVVHLHEPIAPMPGWDTLMATSLPLVGTFHCYSVNRLTNGIGNLAGARRRLNRLHVRIAVSEAAAWTGRRFFGGHYRVVPNGVDVPEIPWSPAPPADRLRIAFVGQAVERKGLPVLLRAFEALREHVPAELTIVGAGAEEVEPLMLDARGVRVLGKISDAEKQRVLLASDVLAAPSLGGESFGMVLTEAFATATPVVASDIAGYRDVVRNGHEGLLVPHGDARELAEALRDLWLDPARRLRMARAASQRARRYAWPTIADEVADAYRDAIATPAPEGLVARAAVRVGVRPADGRPAEPPRRLPTIEPPAPAGARRPALALLRRGALAVAALAGVVFSLLALQRIGFDQIGDTLISSSPPWVLAGLGLMCVSMLVRAFSWHAILRAALPDVAVRRADAVQGTLIGVLMSATLPARLGEPSRALIVARRVGRPRESLPVVLGTLVSQTLLNVLALTILGVVMFSTVGIFSGHERALVAIALAPIVVLAAVLVAPALLRRGSPSRYRRAQAWLAQTRAALHGVRRGLLVFRQPRLAIPATLGQLLAWAIQLAACYALLVALGLDGQVGIGAVAAVLFAVNVTAVLPATPSNLGVFQAACVAVLHSYGVNAADALGYGIILQAVELTTAVVMGMPALVKEGVSWRDVRLRALHASQVELRPRHGARPNRVEAGG